MNAAVVAMAASGGNWLENVAHVEADYRTCSWSLTQPAALLVGLLLYAIVSSLVWLQLQSASAGRLTTLICGRLARPYNGAMCICHAVVGGLLLVVYHASGRSYLCQDRNVDDISVSADALLQLMWAYLVLKAVATFDALIVLAAAPPQPAASTGGGKHGGGRDGRLIWAVVLNGALSVSAAWAHVRYGGDGHGVPGFGVLCVVDALTYGYYWASTATGAYLSTRQRRVHVSRAQLAGTAAAFAHFALGGLADCRHPGALALAGAAFAGARLLRLFDFYTEQFVLNGVRLGLDWSIIAAMLENCCFAQANPTAAAVRDDEDDEDASGSSWQADAFRVPNKRTSTTPPALTPESTVFRAGFSGPVEKPKRG